MLTKRPVKPTKRRGAFIWPGVFVGLFLAPPALAETRYFKAEYELYLRGILFGRADLRADISDIDISLSAHVTSAGIARLFSTTHFASSATAQHAEGALVPIALQAQWISDNVIKTTRLSYANGVPVTFVSGYVPPPDAEQVAPVSFDMAGSDTLNPFLALLAPLANNRLETLCQGETRLFDGRRLARLTASSSANLPVGAHDFPIKADVQACTVAWQPLGGYSSRTMSRVADFKPAKTHWAQLADTGFAAPVEINALTRLGRLSVRATAFFTQIATPQPLAALETYLQEDTPQEQRRGRRRRFN